MAQTKQSDDFNKLVHEIGSFFNRDQLEKGWYHYAKRFYIDHHFRKWDDVDPIAMLHIAQSKKNIVKPEMEVVAFSVLRNEDVFKEFFSSLPFHLRHLIERLVWEDSIARKEVEEITRISILEPRTRDWDPLLIKKDFSFFITKVYDYYSYRVDPDTIKVDVSLPLPLRMQIIPYFPKPAGYYIKTVEEPKGEGLKTFNAEESINQELPSLLTYYMQDQIKYSEKGRPNTTGMKKLQRVLQLKEFFSVEDFQATRSMLMAGLIYNYKAHDSRVAAHDIIKHLFRQLFIEYPSAPYMLNTLKGFGYFNRNDFRQDVNKNILVIFSLLMENKWVTIENLHTYTKTHFIDLAPLSEWKLTSKIHYEDETTFSNKQGLKVADFPRFIYRPIIAGSAFLFAAFGLLEISYREPPADGRFGKDWFSEYDGIYAVKLTALGAYVLSLRKDYQPPENQSENKLTLDTNSLMIRVEGNPEIARVQLMNFAQKVSGNRYQFSQGLFLKDCKKSADIANKIILFRQSIGQSLPPYWEQYLNRLVTNSKLIKKSPKMIVFQLPADNKELQRLLVQDESIKKLIIKAEQYYILVATENETAFRTRLKEVGILLE